MAWDRDTGEPLHRAIVWQDRRTAARCDELRDGRPRAARARAHRARARPLLLRHQDRVAAPRGRRARPGAAFGTIDSWLVFKLTGAHVTDYSNASRTLLFDIRRAALGPRAVRAARRARARAARAAAERRRATARRAEFGGSRAGGGHRRRPAGGALRPGLPRARASARTPTAPAASCSRTRAASAPAPAEGLLTTVAWGVERPRGLRARGGDLRDRRRGAVAARRPRRHRAGGRDRGAGALARRQRRRLPRARVHRPRLAALGPLRARHDRRAHARHRARPPRPRGARGDRPTRRSTRCARWRRPSGVRARAS